MTQSSNKLIALLLPLLAAVAFTFGPVGAHAAGFDQDFIGKMVPHHQMGIEMAKDCVQKATHRELKDLCQQIAKLYPKATIFTGKLVFREERFYYGFLHSETARAIQRR